MSRVSRVGILIPALFVMVACSDMNAQQQRALSGGAIGAAGGAVVGAIAGAPLLGAAVGAAGGAAIGAVTTPDHDRK